ncbi:early activation antigen CD69-like, partial [Hyla sarda]|uniref:early activation antigen CD69-like n=1 Tax=Hyla sarda TaxID=327740 RepID=UPI0024C3FF3E
LCEEKTEDTCVVRGDQVTWLQRLNPGRRWAVRLVPILVILCVTLLITTINGRVSCISPGAVKGSGSAISSPADGFSPCPDPWIHITDKCYFFSEDKKDRKDSEKDCEERNSRLATVTEGTILRLVTTTEQEFWIGLFTLGTHHGSGTWSGRWSDGSVVNVTKGSGTCAKIHRVLVLHNCNGELHWICERDVRNP